MASKGNSVFSRIIRRELPATFLHEDDQVNQERCVTRPNSNSTPTALAPIVAHLQIQQIQRAVTALA